MKKGLLAICIAALVIFVFILSSQEKKISGILKSNYNDITKIVIFDGKEGKQAAVDDKEKVKEFMGLVDSYVLKKIKGSPEVKPGPAYSVRFYIGDRMAFTLEFISPKSNSNLGINGREYKVVKTDLSFDKIESFIK